MFETWFTLILGMALVADTPGQTVDLTAILSTATGAAIVTVVGGIILAVIAWFRGLRPDARAEMEAALLQQRETIARLSSSNQTQQDTINQLRNQGQTDLTTLQKWQLEVTLTRIYIIKLEAYCDELEDKLRKMGVPIDTKNRPVPPHHIMEDTMTRSQVAEAVKNSQ